MAKDPREKLFRKSKIEIIKIFEDSETSALRGSFLIHNKKGSGFLSLISARDRANKQYEILMYKKHPLLVTAADGVFEESRERLVSAGEGFGKILGRKLPKVCETGDSLSDAVYFFQDYINMLPEAGYLIYENALFPSRGDGSFFYNISDKLTEEAGSLEINESYTSCRNIMKYMLPTLEPEALDVELIKNYRKILHDGGDVGYSLALHIGSGINVLLCGHEKAVAAAAVGTTVKCAVATPVSRHITGKRPHRRFIYSDISVAVNGLPEATLSNGLTKQEPAFLNAEATHAVIDGTGKSFGMEHFGSSISVRYPSFNELLLKEKNNNK